MRNSWTFEPSGPFAEMIAFDRVEIDSPDQNDHLVIHYRDRLRTIQRLVREVLPDPTTARIGEFGCAQGNIALLLAESGYKLWAVDSEPERVAYGRAKQERGEIQWISGDFRQLPLPENFFDLVILGEVLTLTTNPAALLKAVSRYIRQSGFILLTYPNSARLLLRLPEWDSVSKEAAAVRESRQHHLFKISSQKILAMLPDFQVKEQGYCGSTILINRHTDAAIKHLPGDIYQVLNVLARVPLVNRYTFKSSYLLLQKNSHS